MMLRRMLMNTLDSRFRKGEHNNAMLDRIKQALGQKTPTKTTQDTAARDSDNLLDWWETTFSPEEQDYILTKYRPMVMGIEQEVSKTDLSCIIRPDGTLGSIGSLTALSTWFLTGDEITLARRILAKAVERQEAETGNIVDKHFTYGHMIRVYYRDRNRDENALALAIEACEKQISIAPQVIREWPEEWGEGLPVHGGFLQLAIILEKNKDYEGAIRLSEEALRQGWNGDWEKRIARCKQRSNR